MDDLMNSMGFMGPIWAVVMGVYIFRGVMAFLLGEIEIGDKPRRRR